jgi:hypothetical protein
MSEYPRPPRQPRKARRRFLDASLVPLESALLSRADALEGGEEPIVSDTPLAVQIQVAMAAEYRALAEELHHW